MSQPPPGLPPPILGSYPSSQPGSYSQPSYTQPGFSQAPTSGGPGFNQPPSSVGVSWNQIQPRVSGGSVMPSHLPPLMESEFECSVRVLVNIYAHIYICTHTPTQKCNHIHIHMLIYTMHTLTAPSSHTHTHSSLLPHTHSQLPPPTHTLTAPSSHTHTHSSLLPHTHSQLPPPTPHNHLLHGFKNSNNKRLENS